MHKGDTITPYAGPTPPRGTHRYIFILYEQVRLTRPPRRTIPSVLQHKLQARTAKRLIL